MPLGERHHFDRATNLERLRSEAPFDVVVIGGGITGTGIALDAASRGLSTALIERDDFASGTSSKSSKLVHGGLRYLQQGDIRLVYEALHERQRLRRNAPHLVSVLPFMIPIFSRDGLLPKKIARALGTAMWMYDLTGGLRLGKVHKRLRTDAAHAHMPTLAKDRLSSAYLYYDATADDARLTLTIARTAAAHGAVVVNRCAVSGFLPGGGVRVTDHLLRSSAGQGGVDRSLAGAPHTRDNGPPDDEASTFIVPARVVVNAAGVWSDSVRALHETPPPDSIRPAKGVHITVPWDLIRNDVAVVIPVPDDKRSLFVVPWNERPDGTFEHCYIGTTDTDYDGPIDEPQCTADDIAYILGAVNAVLDPSAHRPMTVDDITATWAGLRPLVASATSGRTADLSRRHDVTVDGGIISVTGGKLTTYREMAEDTVGAVTDQLGRNARCQTKRLPLLGVPTPDRPGSIVATIVRRLTGAVQRRSPPSPDAEPVDPVDPLVVHLAGRYGSLAEEVLAMIDADPTLRTPLVAGLPYVRAEAVYAIRDEMATSLTDVLTRRTRAHLLDRDATRRAAPDIARVLAPHAGWDEPAIVEQIRAYDDLCSREAEANGRPGAATATPVDHLGSAEAGVQPT